MRTASWVLLAIVGGLTLVGSLVSTYLAYQGAYPVGGVKVEEVAGDRPAVLSALRGIRGTSAAYAAGFAILFLSIVLGPYRRGDVWAFWAVAGALLALVGIVALRVPLLGTRLGLAGPAIQAGIGLVALLLDAKRLSA